MKRYKKHLEKLSNVLKRDNARVSGDLETLALGIGIVLAHVLEDLAMDEITKAYVCKLESQRDEAENHAADIDIECQELREQVSVLVGELIRVKQDSNYPVVIPNTG